VAGETVGGVAGQVSRLDPLRHCADQPIAEGDQAGVFGRPVFLRQLECGGQTDDVGNVLRASAAMAFVAAASLSGQEGGARPDVEQPHPLGAVELVGGEAQQVNP